MAAAGWEQVLSFRVEVPGLERARELFEALPRKVRTTWTAIHEGSDALKKASEGGRALGKSLREGGEEAAKGARRASRGQRQVREGVEVSEEAVNSLITRLERQTAVTSEAYGEAGRQMRWIGRDVMRIGSMIGRVGTWIERHWRGITEASVVLGATIEDIRWGFEDMGAEIGDVIAEYLEPVVDIVWRIADVFEDLPEPLKAVIGGFVLFGVVAIKLSTLLIAAAGTIVLTRFGLMGIAKEAGVATEKLGMFGTICKVVRGILTGTLAEERRIVRTEAQLNKLRADAFTLTRDYARVYPSLGKAMVKSRRVTTLYNKVSKSRARLVRQELLPRLAVMAAAERRLTRERAAARTKLRALRSPTMRLKWAMGGLAKAAKLTLLGMAGLFGGGLLLFGLFETFMPVVEAFGRVWEWMEPYIDAIAEAFHSFIDILEGLPGPLKLS